MRGLASYIFAAAFVVLAMGVIAPPLGLGFAVVARPSADGDVASQRVDRTHKGDRLRLPLANGRKSPPSAPAMLVGCEPVFSSLSAGARANFAGRCVA